VCTYNRGSYPSPALLLMVLLHLDTYLLCLITIAGSQSTWAVSHLLFSTSNGVNRTEDNNRG
jgi:hypothetical protein